MTKETRELAEQIADFGAGSRAYYESENELYFSGSPAFRAGFKNAFHEDNPQYDDGGNGSDAAFEAYIDNFHFERAYTPEPSGDIAKVSFGETAREWIINTLSDPPRVICLAAIVGIGIGETIYQVVFVGGMR